MSHSIPESNALIIRTPHGTVLHTGDWKLDQTPGVGLPTDQDKLRSLGEEGVLAVVGNSTNTVRDGRSPSEADVARTIAELIASSPARVAVTTFASNVARLRAVADGAKAAGREVVVVGRAMERVVQVARETGYLDGVQEFRGPDVYGYLPPDKVVALCTGSQGEPRAALARIARDDHPDITLARGDRVIFSSRTIPGNEKAVSGVINGLIDQGIEVITDRTHLIHVSGHPRIARGRGIARLGQAEDPDPGAWRGAASLRTCRDRAAARHSRDRQLPQRRSGRACARHRRRSSTSLPHGRVYKDGVVLVGAESRTIADRRRLSFVGMVTVALAVTEKGVLAADPEVELLGIPGTRPGRQGAGGGRAGCGGGYVRKPAAAEAPRSGRRSRRR